VSVDPVRIDLWRSHWMLRGAEGVNVWLIPAGTGFVLVDTGFPSRRRDLEAGLLHAGCGPGRLRLVVITHADLDHTGHARRIREAWGAPLALHEGEVEAARTGDMSASRRPRAWPIRLLLRILGLLARRFTPDRRLVDGEDLTPFGLSARVVHLPGHTRGSIGVLTAAGDLFCGDLLWNVGRPELQPDPDDPGAAHRSVARLRELGARRIFPGHGAPFAIDDLAPIDAPRPA
jgi:glyoxylase-like metal-dependent hydrolase (beta-lactamase superfamily II)